MELAQEFQEQFPSAPSAAVLLWGVGLSISRPRFKNVSKVSLNLGPSSWLLEIYLCDYNIEHLYGSTAYSRNQKISNQTANKETLEDKRLEQPKNLLQFHRYLISLLHLSRMSWTANMFCGEKKAWKIKRSQTLMVMSLDTGVKPQLKQSETATLGNCIYERQYHNSSCVYFYLFLYLDWITSVQQALNLPLQF